MTADNEQLGGLRQLLFHLQGDTDPFEEFEGNGSACRFCFSRRDETHLPGCAWSNREQLSALLAAYEAQQEEIARLRTHGARLFGLIGVLHKTVRGDELGECWTIRHWLDSQGQFNDDISGQQRLIEIACAHALAKWPVTEAAARPVDAGSEDERNVE